MPDLTHEQWYKKCEVLRERIRVNKYFADMEDLHETHKLFYKTIVSCYEDSLNILMRRK